MIEVRDLLKTFGTFTGVDHISFSVPVVGIRAFLAPNGTGNTAIEIVTTVLMPDAGHIRVAGHDPVRERMQLRRTFGIVSLASSSVSGSMRC